MPIQINYPGDPKNPRSTITKPVWIAAGIAPKDDTEISCKVKFTVSGSPKELRGTPLFLALQQKGEKGESDRTYVTRRYWVFLFDMRDYQGVESKGQVVATGNDSGDATRDVVFDLPQDSAMEEEPLRVMSASIIDLNDNDSIPTDGFVAWGVVSETGSEPEGEVVSAILTDEATSSTYGGYVTNVVDADFWAAMFPTLQLGHSYTLNVVDNHSHSDTKMHLTTV